MAMIPLENLGKAGFNVDVEPHNLAPEFLTDGENIRFLDGNVGKIEGESAWAGTPTIAPHWVMPATISSINYWFYGGVDKVYRTDGTAHLNVTRYTAAPGDDDYDTGARPMWTGGVLHGVPIINNNNATDPPQEWDSATNRFKDLSNFPASTYCKVIRTYKNFLIALDITKTSTNYPYMVKWSSVADPGSVPSSWDETDPTVLAGENTIAQTTGKVLDCLPLGENNIIYKEDSIWGMQFVGGVNVFRFYEISGTIGALGPRCMVEFYRKHLVVGQDDIVIFDGTKPVSIMHQRIRKWFFGNLHPSYTASTVVSLNPQKKEVWICFVESGSVSTYLTKALIWNWETNIWSVKDLPTIAHMNYGIVPTADNSFDGSSGTIFDNDSGSFNLAGASPALQDIIMAKPYSSAELFLADDGYTAAGTEFRSRIERTGLAIAGQDRQGNVKVDPASVKIIRAVFPKISAPTPVDLLISIGASMSPDGAITWEGPYTFNSGTDVQLNFTVSGKYLAYRIEETGALPWRMSGMTLDLDVISMF